VLSRKLYIEPSNNILGFKKTILTILVIKTKQKLENISNLRKCQQEKAPF